MKRSNLLLSVLSCILLAALFVTDHLLVLQYAAINLSDPYKNYQSIAVSPFKALKISGGNGYAIRIIQGDHYNIRLMNSRKDFFKMKMLQDTLSVTFTVANQNHQQPQETTVGLIIFLPKIAYLQFSGTNNEVGPLLQDSLTIQQNTNTVTRLKELRLNYLSLNGTATSYFDLLSNNTALHLRANMKNKAVVNFNQISFIRFTPLLQDSAAIVVYKTSLESLMHH